MRYFSYIAEQSFSDSPDGNRLFYQGGPFSRPYIIPDTKTEKKLFRKQLWLMRFILGTLILGQPFLVYFMPEVIRNPIWFLLYLACVGTFSWVGSQFTFRKDLSKLDRIESRPTLHSFYSNMSRKHRTISLVLGVFGSLVFVAIGIGMIFLENRNIIGLVLVSFFFITAMSWGYALYLKISGNDNI